MAVDKLVDSTQLDADLTSVANAIRTKGGTSAQLAFPADFVTAIAAIQTGGGVSYDDLATEVEPFGDVSLTITEMKPHALAFLIGKSTGWRVYGSRVTTMGKNALQGCTYLKEAHFPALTSANSNGYQFNGCVNLQILDLGLLDTICANMMSSCAKLQTIILRRSTAITALSSTNAFNSGRFANNGAGGTIYIPKALYDHLGDGTSLDYQHATNWSTIYGYGTITWAKIEGSIYEL